MCTHSSTHQLVNRATLTPIRPASTAALALSIIAVLACDRDAPRSNTISSAALGPPAAPSPVPKLVDALTLFADSTLGREPDLSVLVSVLTSLPDFISIQPSGACILPTGQLTAELIVKGLTEPGHISYDPTNAMVRLQLSLPSEKSLYPFTGSTLSITFTTDGTRAMSAVVSIAYRVDTAHVDRTCLVETGATVCLEPNATNIEYRFSDGASDTATLPGHDLSSLSISALVSLLGNAVNGTVINSRRSGFGAVFINGELIPPPYSIATDNLDVVINGHHLARTAAIEAEGPINPLLHKYSELSKSFWEYFSGWVSSYGFEAAVPMAIDFLSAQSEVEHVERMDDGNLNVTYRDSKLPCKVYDLYSVLQAQRDGSRDDAQKRDEVAREATNLQAILNRNGVIVYDQGFFCVTANANDILDRLQAIRTQPSQERIATLMKLMPLPNDVACKIAAKL